jgi:hypothetical protein
VIADASPHDVRLAWDLFCSVAEGGATIRGEGEFPPSDVPCTRFTGSCGGNVGGFARNEAMNSASVSRKARWSSRESRRYSRSNRGPRSNVGTTYSRS